MFGYSPICETVDPMISLDAAVGRLGALSLHTQTNSSIAVPKKIVIAVAFRVIAVLAPTSFDVVRI
jgi:hypothetical protein